MRALITLLRNALRCQSGTAAMEGIIVMPLAISLMVGGVEFGRILSAYSTADKSMRSATRYLAQVPAEGVCTWGLTNAQNLAVYGRIDGTGTELIKDWTPANVTLEVIDCAAAFPDPAVIELRAAVPFPLAVANYLGLSNPFTLNVRHQERHIGE